MSRLCAGGGLPESGSEPGLAPALGRSHCPLESPQRSEQGPLERHEFSVDSVTSCALLDQGGHPAVDVLKAGEQRGQFDGVIHGSAPLDASCPAVTALPGGNLWSCSRHWTFEGRVLTSVSSFRHPGTLVQMWPLRWLRSSMRCGHGVIRRWRSSPSGSMASRQRTPVSAPKRSLQPPDACHRRCCLPSRVHGRGFSRTTLMRRRHRVLFGLTASRFGIVISRSSEQGATHRAVGRATRRRC